MSEWFQRQFGDRGEFALCVSLGTDPHPTGQPDLDLTWGTLEIWTRNRCLTSCVFDSGVAQGVRWTLLPILQWIRDVGIRLVNEDPYPRFSKGRDVGDASEWYDATLNPPLLSADQERRWFMRRSEWRNHHALRRAAEDVALPNVVFRRLGESIEVSWDNDTWSAPRPDLNFVEKRGREMVSAAMFAAVVRESFVEVLSALSKRIHSLPSRLLELSRGGAAFRADAGDWRWLIHRPTATLICREMPQLRDKLDQATKQDATGLYVPHTSETLVLRNLRLEHKSEIEAMLKAAEILPQHPLTESLRNLVRARPAANKHPWEEGNDYAETVRAALGWGVDPLPELVSWMQSERIKIPSDDLGLPPSVAVFSKRTNDFRAMVHVNPRGGSPAKRETGFATALGHLLLDELSVSIDGDWEHWPTSARARAFGVALMLPEDGVRELLIGTTSIGATEVQTVMKHYRAGPVATTYRLKNLGLISTEEQIELVQAVG